jgi:hypothetical protein
MSHRLELTYQPPECGATCSLQPKKYADDFGHNVNDLDQAANGRKWPLIDL